MKYFSITSKVILAFIAHFSLVSYAATSAPSPGEEPEYFPDPLYRRLYRGGKDIQRWCKENGGSYSETIHQETTDLAANLYWCLFGTILSQKEQKRLEDSLRPFCYNAGRVQMVQRDPKDPKKKEIRQSGGTTYIMTFNNEKGESVAQALVCAKGMLDLSSKLEKYGPFTIQEE